MSLGSFFGSLFHNNSHDAGYSDDVVNYKKLADQSDRKAKDRKIDPPRPGRKTYNQRYSETSSMSTSDIHAKIAERKAQGKECGVLYRTLADRT
jgi:hypothetical protein